jgi:type I restriction enzyme M protein
VAEVFRKWKKQPKLSHVITREEAQAADYNLSPSQFVEINDRVKHRELTAIMAELADARTAREKVDLELVRQRYLTSILVRSKGVRQG